MVEPYVEALRYLTPLGFDILTFTIIDRLAGSGEHLPAPHQLPRQTQSSPSRILPLCTIPTARPHPWSTKVLPTALWQRHSRATHQDTQALPSNFKEHQTRMRVPPCAGRQKLKEDGVNIADWLTGLTLFTVTTPVLMSVPEPCGRQVSEGQMKDTGISLAP